MTPTFSELIKAGYPAIWLHTHEDQRAIDVLRKQLDKYQVYAWDCDNGITEYIEEKDTTRTTTVHVSDDILKAYATGNQYQDHSILFLKDFHWYCQNMPSIRIFKNCIPALKATDKHLVIVSPVIRIPVELEKDITLHSFALPTVKEITDRISSIAKNTKSLKHLKLTKDDFEIARGLTMEEAENASSLSLCTTKSIDREIIEHEKMQAVRKSGLMEVYPAIPESELGGLWPLKQYIKNRRRGFYEKTLPIPKGILLMGLPGSGKSLSAKVIASVLGFPLIRMDIGNLKGGLVGESERRTREALSIVDAISPCVLWLDELEKVLGGVQSSNRTDSGTTATMFSMLLTWMQESNMAKYVIGTVNDIGELLQISQGALLRAGRFDETFFLDVPTLGERVSILQIMNKRYGTKVNDTYMDKADGWTGAEIEQFVKDSCYDGVEEAFKNIRPIINQNKITIEHARTWALANARMANGTDEHETITRDRQLRVIQLREEE